MTQEISVVVPLAVGLIAAASTILIQALPLSATVGFFRRAQRLGLLGTNFQTDISIVLRVISYSLIAHLVEIALWALLFIICGQFATFGTAYYHSAVNFTTLGYGDIIMSPSWKLLGPMEAADGTLMFGVSTAMIFAIIQRLIQARFADLKD